MRVSVALHTDDPGEDGNQRTFEAKYQNYNRQYVDLLVDEKNCDAFGMKPVITFPTVGEDTEDQVFRFFSLGVCTGPGTHSGGSIIVRGPLDNEIDARKIGAVPSVINFTVGIFGQRLRNMMAEGKLFTFGDEWPPVDGGTGLK